MATFNGPPGRRDQRVTVQTIKSSPTRNDSNEIDLNDDANWETHCRRWAKVVPRGGREFFQSDETQSEITHDVTLPSDPQTRAITSAMRIAWGAKRLQIVTTFDVENRRIEQYAGCRE